MRRLFPTASFLCFILVFVLCAARFAVELAAPISIDDEKYSIYLRDIVLIGPAALFFFASTLDARVYGPAKQWTDVLCLGVPGWLKAITCGVFCALVSIFVFRTVAQILDEAVYRFQGNLFASGHLMAPVPREFVLDFSEQFLANRNGYLFGVFFPGQSMALAIGTLLHAPWIINPIFTAVLCYLTWSSGCSLYNREVGGVAAAVFLLSPFVLFQGASYFSHVLAACLFCGSLFLFISNQKGLAWWDAVSGILLGGLFLQRPFSAIPLVASMLLYSVWMINYRAGARRLMVVGCVSAIGLVALFCYNKILTGNFLITPHQYLLQYSEFHFGLNITTNTAINLVALSVDFAGLPVISIVPILALAFARRDATGLEIFLLVVCGIYIFSYGFFWYHGVSYGPRFWFELVPIFCILTAISLRDLPPGEVLKPVIGDRKVVTLFIAGSTILTIAGILPARFKLWSERAAYYSLPADIGQRVQPPAAIFIKRENKERLWPIVGGLQFNGPITSAPIVYLNDFGRPSDELRPIVGNRHLYCLNLSTKETTEYPCPKQ
jgi:hypothetical protein